VTAGAARGLGSGERVVVAVDFSDGSISAATWVAQHFARGAELVLVHVLHVPPVPRFLEGRYPSRDQVVENATAGAQTRLRELSARIATGLVWPEVRVGEPDQEIVRVAAEYSAALIVVGRPATRGGVWARIGTTAQRVLRRSTVPVLLAADVPSREPSRLLVAVDDSDMTDVVLGWGASLAKRFSAATTVMHVVAVPVFPEDVVTAAGLLSAAPGAMLPVMDDGSAVREAERWLGERVQRIAADEPVALAVVPRPLSPAQAILDEATGRRVDLIVVGSRGAGAVPRFLFGSVAEGVLRGASCPVLVVPPPNGADDGGATSAGRASSSHDPGNA
jgi:nucleotide-binding universal stress UspA family protein